MSILNNDLDYSYYVPQKDVLEQVKKILDENEFFKKEVRELRYTVSLLKNELKAHNITTFDLVPINKKPTEMTREELLKANKGVTARMKPKATSSEKIPMPTEEEFMELYSRKNDEQDVNVIIAKIVVQQEIEKLKESKEE